VPREFVQGFFYQQLVHRRQGGRQQHLDLLDEQHDLQRPVGAGRPGVPRPTISDVKVIWPATYYARQFQIQTSTDGTNWTTQYTPRPASAPAARPALTFTPVSARYVRVYCTTRNNSSYYGVSELPVVDDRHLAGRLGPG